MNYAANDPDDLVQKKIDLNHITKMSYQMHVPDSITVGPNRPTVPRLHSDDGQLPVRMEVPNTIRLAAHANAGIGTKPDQNFSSEQLAFHPTDGETLSDDEYATVDKPAHNQSMRLAESWHVEPFAELDDKQFLNKLQLLQNRINRIERTLARRDLRDRFVYTLIIGYVVLQTLFSFRRSMLN